MLKLVCFADIIDDYIYIICHCVLIEGYLNGEFNRCYCESCHKIRGDEPLGQCGDPPREYSTPFGWSKFGLRCVLKTESKQLNHCTTIFTYYAMLVYIKDTIYIAKYILYANSEVPKIFISTHP